MKNIHKGYNNAFCIRDRVNTLLILPDLANDVKTGSGITVKILLG